MAFDFGGRLEELKWWEERIASPARQQGHTGVSNESTGISSIIFSGRNQALIGMERIHGSGSDQIMLVNLQSPERAQEFVSGRRPVLSRDKSSIAYEVTTWDNDTSIWTIRLDGSHRLLRIRNAEQPCW